MNCWKLLDLKPTNDRKLIKRAYAKKLKAMNPECDIVGFQALRKAYEDAISFLGQSAKYYENTNFDEAESTSVDIDLVQRGNDAPIAPFESPSLYNSSEVQNSSHFSDIVITERRHDTDRWEQVDHYLYAVDQLLHDPVNKYDPDSWTSLWQHDYLSQLALKEILFYQLFDYFIDKTPSIKEIEQGNRFIPDFLLPMYDQIFGWSNDELNLSSQFEEEDIDILIYLASSDQAQVNMHTAEHFNSNIGRIFLAAATVIGVAFILWMLIDKL